MIAASVQPEVSNVGEAKEEPEAPEVRVLVGLLVYDGETFVPSTLESLVAMRAASRVSVEVVVFDDASPLPGWSKRLEALCGRLDIGYYCSPRNLGIPRNMNLVLGYGEAGGFALTVLLNSDVIVPANLADELVSTWQCAEQDGGGAVGSITAWSNNASVFSLPNADADQFVSDQRSVDRVASLLASGERHNVVDLPVGMGFCLAIPAEAIGTVGLMDPVFGRGYCEEVDWCNRATERGLRHVLAITTFVYHMGSATTRLAGLLAPGEQTVQVNEAIIDERYPLYRSRIARWERDGGVKAAVSEATSMLVRAGARERGYAIHAGWLPSQRTTGSTGHLDDRSVQFHVTPDGRAPLVHAMHDGFRVELDTSDLGILEAVAAFVGDNPNEVRISDYGSVSSQLDVAARSRGVRVERLPRYRERV